MASASFKSKLNNANKLWKDGAKQKSETLVNDVPDGRYECTLQKMEFCESKGSGRLQCCMTMEIASGEFKGKKVFEYRGLETEDNLAFFAADLARLGYEIPEDFAEEIQGILDDVAKTQPEIIVQFKTSSDGQFQNKRLIGLLNEGGEEEEEGEESEMTVDVGDRVTFAIKLKGGKEKQLAGEVTELTDDGIKVKRDDNGKIASVLDGEYEVIQSDESEQEEEEVEEQEEEQEEGSEVKFGSKVTFSVLLKGGKEKTVEGEVIELTETGVKVKRDDTGKTVVVEDGSYSVILSEEEEQEEEEDGGDEDVVVGSKIKFVVKTKDGKEKQVSGIVEELVDESTVKVRRSDNDKVAKVSVDQITYIENEVPEEPEEEPEVEEEEIEESEVEVGSEISWKNKGAVETGSVTEIFDNGSVRARRKSDKKLVRLKEGTYDLV